MCRRSILVCFGFLFALLPLVASAQVLHTQTANGDVWLLEDGDSWRLEHVGSADRLPVTIRSEISSLQSSGTDRWIAAGVEHVEGTMRLAVVDGRETARLLPRPATTGALLGTPAVIAGPFGPRAIAWLEGDAHDRLEVRTAQWTGWGWTESRILAPTAPGSQTALTGATLGDGNGLIVWVAFDGVDDELMWSRFDGNAWSTPRPLAADNQVPDLTPALYATPDGGAVVAWARFDGKDYRLALARFDGDDWSTPRTVGPKGAILPRWHAAGDTAVVIHRTARPGNWALHEVGADSAVLRSLEVAGDPEVSPIVAAISADGIVIRDRIDAPPKSLGWVR
ncbi:MAG: hypothetical protein AAGD38_20985 [Acidobacteriota bacterium]